MSFLRILRFAFVDLRYGFEVRGCGYALVGGMAWFGDLTSPWLYALVRFFGGYALVGGFGDLPWLGDLGG